MEHLLHSRPNLACYCSLAWSWGMQTLVGGCLPACWLKWTGHTCRRPVTQSPHYWCKPAPRFLGWWLRLPPG